MAGGQARVGQDVGKSFGVTGNDDPAGRGDPFLGLPDQPFGHFPGIERRVGFSHGFDDRLPPIETGPQRARAVLHPRGQIRPTGAPRRTRRGVTLARKRSHRS